MLGSLSLKSNLLCSACVDEPVCEATWLGLLFPPWDSAVGWLRQTREPKAVMRADAPGTTVAAIQSSWPIGCG